MVKVSKKTLKKVIAIIIAVIITFSAVSFAATKMIYDSIFARTENSQSRAEGVLHSYPCGDSTLTGYLTDSDERSALVVIAPGFHDTAEDFAMQTARLQSEGFGVFAFDPTGSGLSGGDSYVGFCQELADVEATLEYIENNGRFGYNDIVLLGHSRGGYAVCCALSLEYDIAAVISVSGVNSAMEGVIGMSERYVGPLAYGNYGFLWLYQSLLFGTHTANLSAAECIINSDVPVLIAHGEDDTALPCDKYSITAHREQIGERAEFILYEDTGHTDILSSGKLLDDITDFIYNSIN